VIVGFYDVQIRMCLHLLSGLERMFKSRMKTYSFQFRLLLTFDMSVGLQTFFVFLRGILFLSMTVHRLFGMVMLELK